MPRHAAGGATASGLHAQLRSDIAAFLAQKRGTEERARANATRLLHLPAQSDNAAHVAVACRNVTRLLGQLRTDTQLDAAPGGASGGDDAAAANVSAAAALRNDAASDEVATLRAYASDDTTLETTSVADYAAEPPMPPRFSPGSVGACVGGAVESIAKIAASVGIIQGMLSEGAQWWGSAVVVRRLKTHAVRANYHARKVKSWGDQCRSHMFVSSSVVNRSAHNATAELRELRSQAAAAEARNARAVAAHATRVAERDRLAARLAELEAAVAIAQTAVREAAVPACGLPESAVLADCETALLLARLPSVAATQKAAKVVLESLAARPTLPQPPAMGPPGTPTMAAMQITPTPPSSSLHPNAAPSEAFRRLSQM